MEKAVPRGDWLEADAFRDLVRQVAPLRPGGWSLPEFERAISALGWELRGPREVGGQIWRRFVARKGPWGGYGTVIADASEPEQVRKVNVRVVDLPAEDLRTAADPVRAAWWVMEEELGPPTLWGGDAGPWMMWRRPGACLAVHTHDEGEVSLELLPADAGTDVIGRGYARGSWRAADPAGLPPVPTTPTRRSTSGGEVQKRLYEALRSLTYDAPFFPARFILHLSSARDPQRFVQCWSHGLELVIEATGYLHHPELADPARLTRNGWELPHSLWQRRFPDARDDHAQAETAARMLVEELRQLAVDPADLVHGGSMTGRGRGFHLDLPHLGLPRTHPGA
ncbi:hypothetical protein [Streptomyces sp. NPDC005780]|uniref:TY-Chap domain-containing protein n=1 Tax=Streptomyces sp. NPDC005780 TaxID=3364730 RepID=UPI0036B4709A